MLTTSYWSTLMKKLWKFSSQYPLPGAYSQLMLGSHYSNTHVFSMVFSEPDRTPAEDNLFAEGLINRLSV